MDEALGKLDLIARMKMRAALTRIWQAKERRSCLHRLPVNRSQGEGSTYEN